jgi:aerobic carbon-monoxide dehydrogenase large subunit
MLHAVLVRSPHAHARIGALDATRALKAAGVADVVTFTDLGEAARPLPMVPPHAALRGKNFHVLAGDRARFVGEAVAVVVAESRSAAEDARALVDIAWEPLASVQEPSTPGAARVHDDVADNVAGRVTVSCGDVAAALAAALRRATMTLSIGRAGGQPMETRGVVAEYSATAGLLTVWASSQVPHQVRQFICEVLGLEPHRVRVVAPDVAAASALSSSSTRKTC